MTLNIDLEDVPFAILETVKARIMANRRRLQRDQQRPRPSLRPRPQFVKQGASSKGWRLQKTAAVVLGDGALIISWNAGLPIPSQSDFTLINEFNSNLVKDPNPLVNGIPALGGPGQGGVGFDINSINDSWGLWYVLSSIQPTTTSDFSLESYIQHASVGRGLSLLNIGIAWEGDEPGLVTNSIQTSVSYRSIVNETLYYSFILSGVADPDFASTNIIFHDRSLSTHTRHICIQRINGAFSFFLDGELVLSARTPDSSFLMESRAYVYLELRTEDYSGRAEGLTGVSKLGQVRFTPDRARYPQAGFTPDPLPFSE